MKILILFINIIGVINVSSLENDFDAVFVDFKKVSSQVSVPSVKSLAVSSSIVPSVDSINFWDKLNSGVLDNICKQAKIRLNQDAEIPSLGGITGEFSRWFERYPDKTLALVDEVGLRMNGSIDREVFKIDDIPLNISITGNIEGKSIVVTPIGTERYCKELKLLVDLRKVKTVLPFTKERFLEMKVGEIWKVPVVTVFSFSGGVGGQVVPYVSVSIGASQSNTRTPSVTLYRMSENILRLRIRIERFVVRSLGAQISTTYEISPSEIGLFEAENILTKFVEKEIAKQINKYLALRIGYSFSKTKTKKLLVEFLIDTSNNQQLQALEDFFKGDLTFIKKLIKIGIKFNEFDESQDYIGGISNLNQVVKESSDRLSANPSYAGSLHSNSQGSSLNINIPIIHNHQFSNNITYERYQSIDGSYITHIHQAQRISDGSTLNIPFLGSLIKYREEEKVVSVNRENYKKIDEPVMLYQYHAGFVRNSDYSARAMIDKANSILKYIGADGNGTTDKYLINSETIFPKNPIQYDYEGNPIDSSKTYKQAMISFNLMIAKEGIKEIIFSTPQRILKAYLNMMREIESYLVDKFFNLFRVEGDKVVVDTKNIDMDDSYNNTIGILSHMAYTATKLIEDLFSLRKEPDSKKQAEKLIYIASGKGKSGLAYDKFMKVIVQLVTPINMVGNVYISTNKKVKGEEDVNQSYSVDPDNNLNRIMNEINQERERFSSPSLLKD